MTLIQELKDLGFVWEDSDGEFVIYKAHGSGQNDTVFVTVNVETGEIEIQYAYDEPEKAALVAKFSEWNPAIVRLLEWWSL
jgi:hypothetical protein